MWRPDVAVEILERTTDLSAVGAGLSLWPNALAALDQVGLERPIVASGAMLAEGSVLDRRGKTITKAWSADARSYLGGLPVMVHRSDLQRQLVAACDEIPLRLGVQVAEVAQRNGRAVIRAVDGTEIDADVVVGADGIHSTVRQSVCPGPPHYAGLSAWRAVIPASVEVGNSSMSVDSGKQFLATAVARDRIYHSGLVSLPAGALEQLPELSPFLSETFAGWHQPIPALINATPEDAYIRTDVYYRPPPTQLIWGNIALIGDAAHPVTPDLGQGGCQGIEDAVVLARCLAIGRTDVQTALVRYQDARLARVRRIAANSYRIGRLMAASNPLMALGRNAVLRMTPARLAQRQLSGYASRQSFLNTLPATAR